MKNGVPLVFAGDFELYIFHIADLLQCMSGRISGRMEVDDLQQTSFRSTDPCALWCRFENLNLNKTGKGIEQRIFLLFY